MNKPARDTGCHNRLTFVMPEYINGRSIISRLLCASSFVIFRVLLKIFCVASRYVGYIHVGKETRTMDFSRRSSPFSTFSRYLHSAYTVRKTKRTVKLVPSLAHFSKEYFQLRRASNAIKIAEEKIIRRTTM